MCNGLFIGFGAACILTAFDFYEAQLPVHWKILEIHGTGGRYCEPEMITCFSNGYHSPVEIKLATVQCTGLITR